MIAPKLLGKDGFYGWVNLVVMFFFNLALMPMMMAFTFVLPFWTKEFGWSMGLTSLAQTVSMILSGLSAPLVGIIIMKKGTKGAIVTGNLMAVAGLILLAFQNHIWQLYLGFGVLMGLGVSLGGMLAMMTVMNNWFIIRRPLALSLSMASMGFSGAVINPYLMQLISTVGWRKTYLILAGLALIFCVIVPGLLVKNKPEDLGQVPDGPIAAQPGKRKSGISPYKKLYRTPVDFTAKEALRTVTLWLLVAYGALRFFVMMGMGTHIIAFQFGIGISAVTAAMIGSVMSTVMAVTQLGAGFIALRVNMHTLVRVASFMGMCAFPILLFADSVSMMLIYAVASGIAGGIGSIAMGNLFPDYFGRSEFPKIMGYTMPFNTFFSSFGAPFLGFIHDKTGGYLPGLRIFFVLMVVSFVCILFAKPPMHPSLKGNAQEAAPDGQLAG